MYKIAFHLAFCLVGQAALAQTALQEIDLSARLFARGLADKDALLVATAAQIRRQHDFTQNDLKPELIDGDILPFLLSGAPLDAATMFDAAEGLAADEPAVLALIADLRADAARGVITGQQYAVGTLASHGTDLFHDLTFAGGTYAEVYVEAADGQNMDLIVRDKNGAIVCQDVDVSPVAYCGWTPAVDGVFDVEIRNVSGDHAGYSFMTN